MSGETQVAVIGVGALGEHHARLYSDHPKARLVAVVDTRKDRGQSIAQRYGSRYLSDFSGLLGEVEAVSVTVPTTHHAEVAIPFLERGIPVLVEKPIASTREGARSMVAVAESAGALLMVGHSERFNPAVEAVRPRVSQPLFYEGHRMSVYSGRSLDVDVVLDLMIHDLDLVLEFTNSPLKEFRTAGIPILSSRIDIANVRLEFDNGCVANLTASRVSSERIRKLRFFQANDYISIDFANQSARMYSLVRLLGSRRIVPRKLSISKGEPLAREIDLFLESVRGGRKKPLLPAADGEAGLQALELALTLLEEMSGQQIAKRL